MFRYRKGQGWSIDYTISLLIFIIAGILAFKIITNDFQDNKFIEVRQDAVLISQHLLSKGSPEYWTSSSVVRIGLSESQNRISEAKVENYNDLNYSDTRNAFGVRSEYGFYFEDRNNTIIGMDGQCFLGSDEVSENKNFIQELQPAAYYYNGQSLMSGQMTALNATFYDGNDDDDVDQFYEEITGYEFIMMENPLISTGGDTSLIEKKEALEGYVQEGGILFLSDEVGVNLTGVGFQASTDNDGQVVEDQDDLLDMTETTNIEDDDTVDTSYTVVDQSSTSFTPLAEYTTTSEPWIARWRFGLGTAYYFATTDATYKSMVEVPISEEIGEGADAAVNVSVANCTSIGTDTIGADQIASIDRLAIVDSEIVRMRVIAWQ